MEWNETLIDHCGVISDQSGGFYDACCNRTSTRSDRHFVTKPEDGVIGNGVASAIATSVLASVPKFCAACYARVIPGVCCMRKDRIP